MRCREESDSRGRWGWERWSTGAGGRGGSFRPEDEHAAETAAAAWMSSVPPNWLKWYILCRFNTTIKRHFYCNSTHNKI